MKQLSRGIAAFELKNYDEAVPALERAKTLFPDYAGAQSPYWFLAQIHKAKGNMRGAAAELTEMTLRNEDQYAANVELAGMLEQLGDTRRCGRSARARDVHSRHTTPRSTCGSRACYARVNDKRGAVRERAAVVALNPVDRAEALYQLALAYYQAGEPQAARREVLRALEDAPNFEKAQELLLRLQAGRSGGN